MVARTHESNSHKATKARRLQGEQGTVRPCSNSMGLALVVYRPGSIPLVFFLGATGT